MQNGFDFLHAALPWIAMGLLLAIFSARNASEKKKSQKNGDYGTEGLCLGLCFGSAIGASGVVNIGIGMSLGMLIGLAIGSCIKKRKDDNEKNGQ